MKTTSVYKEQGPLVCPYCKAKQNALSGKALPKDEDISICIDCFKACVIRIDEDEVVTLRLPKGEEEEQICQEASDTVLEQVRRIFEN